MSGFIQWDTGILQHGNIKYSPPSKIDFRQFRMIQVMDIGRTVYYADREGWRNWLAQNYMVEREIWLIFPKKASGKPRIPYDDAVEEALCFGWIDSTAKRIDENSYAQRFTPRNPKTPYSESNKQRLRKLILEGKVIPAVEAAVKDVLQKE